MLQSTKKKRRKIKMLSVWHIIWLTLNIFFFFHFICIIPNIPFCIHNRVILLLYVLFVVHIVSLLTLWELMCVCHNYIIIHITSIIYLIYKCMYFVLILISMRPMYKVRYIRYKYILLVLLVKKYLSAYVTFMKVFFWLYIL